MHNQYLFCTTKFLTNFSFMHLWESLLMSHWNVLERITVWSSHITPLAFSSAQNHFLKFIYVFINQLRVAVLRQQRKCLFWLLYDFLFLSSLGSVPLSQEQIAKWTRGWKSCCSKWRMRDVAQTSTRTRWTNLALRHQLCLLLLLCVLLSVLDGQRCSPDELCGQPQVWAWAVELFLERHLCGPYGRALVAV